MTTTPSASETPAAAVEGSASPPSARIGVAAVGQPPAPSAVDDDDDRRDDEQGEAEEGGQVPAEQLEGLADQLAERAMAVEVEPHPFTR
jgi:hypothetical protein